MEGRTMDDDSSPLLATGRKRKRSEFESSPFSVVPVDVCMAIMDYLAAEPRTILAMRYGISQKFHVASWEVPEWQGETWLCPKGCCCVSTPVLLDGPSHTYKLDLGRSVGARRFKDAQFPLLPGESNVVELSLSGWRSITGFHMRQQGIAGFLLSSKRGVGSNQSVMGAHMTLTSLTALDLSFCSSIENFGPLRRFPQLMKLNLRYTNIGNEGLRLLASGLGGVLEELSLQQCGLISDFRPLKKLVRLRTFNGSSTKMNDEGVKVLSELTSLLEVKLIHCGKVRRFSPLRNCSHLARLRVSCGRDDFCYWDDVPDLSKQELKRLGGRLTVLVDGGDDFAGCFIVLNKLKKYLKTLKLDIDGVCGMRRSIDISDLKPLAALSSIQELKLSHCYVTTIRNVSSLKEFTHLKKLDLTGCVPEWCNAGTELRDITELVAALPWLEELSLGGCNGIKDFTPLKDLPLLKKLNLSRTCLTDAGLEAISTSLVNLEELNLVRNYELTEYSPLMNFRNLLLLNIRDCCGILRAVWAYPVGKFPYITRKERTREQVDKELKAALPKLETLIWDWEDHRHSRLNEFKCFPHHWSESDSDESDHEEEEDEDDE